jgi:bridging integrator 3
VNTQIVSLSFQLLDYDAARSRMKKLIEKPSDDPNKLPKVPHSTVSRLARLKMVPFQAQQEHDEAKMIFDALNDQLIQELPQLMDLRIPYFDPSFEAMIRMQCKFAEEGYEKLGGVQRQVFYILLYDFMS